MLNIVSQESMLEARRKANIETQVPFILNGKKELKRNLRQRKS